MALEKHKIQLIRDFEEKVKKEEEEYKYDYTSSSVVEGQLIAIKKIKEILEIE